MTSTSIIVSEEEDQVTDELIAAASAETRTEVKEKCEKKEKSPSLLTSLSLKFVHLFFPNRDFVKLLLDRIIPGITCLIPLFYTGQIKDETALAVAGQFTFIGVVLKVGHESVVGSLYHVVGRDYLERRSEALEALKMASVVLLILGVLVSGFVLTFTNQLVDVMNTPDSILEQTRQFLYVSAFSFPLAMVQEAVSCHLRISTHGYLVVSSLVKALSIALLNAFLFGTQPLSAHWGVEHLGMYKVIEATVQLIVGCFFFCLIEDVTPFHFLWRVPFRSRWRTNLKSLFDVSWGNFGDSLVRNFFYFAVTLTFINQLGANDAAAWNLVNGIVWSLLLIPAFAVATHVNVAVGLRASQSEQRASLKVVTCEAGGALCAWTIVVGTLSTVFWRRLASFFSPNNSDVQVLSEVMFHHIGWVFVLFSVSSAMNGLLYGTGNTDYICYQSFFTNSLVYIIPWICYLTGTLVPTYWIVIGLYVLGMMVGFCVTCFFCVKVWRALKQ